MKLKVVKRVEETRDAVSLYFKHPLIRKIRYEPGQFITLSFEIEGAILHRAYSFSSSPHVDDMLRITIKRVEKGLVSNHICDQVKEGARISVSGPQGSFFLDPKAKKKSNYLLFGAGSGITPLHSILKSVLDQNSEVRVFLFYANRDLASTLFWEEISEWKNRCPVRFYPIHIMESPPVDQPEIYPGFLRSEIVEELVAKFKIPLEDSDFYMCGPAGFMEKAKEILGTFGIERAKIKMEAFSLPKIKLSGKNLLSQVEFRQGSQTHLARVPGNKTILQQFLSENISIPYSCRSGMCSTCKSKCIEGEVSMPPGHTLPREEVEKGYMLTCISFPTSEKVVIEYQGN